MLRDLLIASGQHQLALTASREVIKLSHRQPDEIRTHAMLAEYAGESNRSIDHWLEYAADTESVDAIDRLIALNKGLYRDRELAQVMTKIVPGIRASRIHLITAQLMVELDAITKRGLLHPLSANRHR